MHKIGAKLDLYEPEIPDNWLDTIVYKSGTFHHTRLSALPVDVRVAIMNFQDQKFRIESLSGVAFKTTGKPSMPQSSSPREAQTYTLGYRGVANGSNR